MVIKEGRSFVKKASKPQMSKKKKDSFSDGAKSFLKMLNIK